MSAAPNIINAMGLSGGAATGKASAKLLAGMREELAKIQPIIDKVVQATGKIAENLTKAKSASSTLFPGTSGTVTSTGFIDEGGGGGMTFGSFVRGMGRAAAVGLTAGAQALDLNQFAESSITRARFGFFSGQGTTGASMTFQGMMNRGTGIDPLDAARAAMAGTSMGLMPTMPGYSNVQSSAETFSNMVPGAGLAGGMQATAALNQASNVNRLRMIGIQIRDPATGTPRSIESIANDLWSKINTQKTGTGGITKQDLAISLQSGNSLDMLLNQYFGNDPVLRQGIVTALMQKASGGDLSRESLRATGALPELAASTGERNAAAFGAIDAYTGDIEQGMIGANRIISEAANIMRDAAGTFGSAVGVFAGAMQLAGGGNGAFGTLGGGILGGLSMGASLVGGGLLTKKLFGGGAKGPNITGPGPTAAVTGAARAIPVAGGVLSALGGGFEQFSRAQEGEDFNLLSALLSTGGAALAGFMLGGPPGAAIGAAAGFGSNVLGYNLGGGSVFGEGDGEDEASNSGSAGRTSQNFNPLEKLAVNAKYLKKRDYLIDGKEPANKYHTGVDFNANVGDAVYSVKDGVVVSAVSTDKGSFGKNIKVRHADGHASVYAHLSAVGVSAGDTVTAGQQIGSAGNTGLSSGPHLHFEVRKNPNDQSTHVDPVAYISGGSSPSGGTRHESAGLTDDGGVASGLLGTLASGIQLLPGLAGSPSPSGEGGEAANGSTTHYGGVNININVPKGTNMDEQKLAREIKKVLNDENVLNKAVTR